MTAGHLEGIGHLSAGRIDLHHRVGLGARRVHQAVGRVEARLLDGYLRGQSLFDLIGGGVDTHDLAALSGGDIHPLLLGAVVEKVRGQAVDGDPVDHLHELRRALIGVDHRHRAADQAGIQAVRVLSNGKAVGRTRHIDRAHESRGCRGDVHDVDPVGGAVAEVKAVGALVSLDAVEGARRDHRDGRLAHG